MFQGKPPHTDVLARYFEGELTKSEADVVERQLQTTAETRDELQRIERIADALSTTDESLKNTDMVSMVRQAIAESNQNEIQKRNRKPYWTGLVLTTGLATAATVAFILFGSLFDTESRDDGEFGIKGDTTTVEGRESWAGIEINRVVNDTTVKQVTNAIASNDEMLIAYRNAGPHPYRYLMVFAVDAQGEVYWYYPAYLSARTDPVSIPIEPRDYIVLEEKVRHKLPEGSLEIHSLFSDRAIRVSEVERLVAESKSNIGKRLKLPDFAEHIVKVKVKQWIYHDWLSFFVYP